VGKKEKDKLNINANPAGALEIEEFKNRMAHLRKGLILKKNYKKDQP
jgi:hypothetical protein